MIYKNLIFIHIPRTGGTSIESALGLRMGNEDKHWTASELKKNVGTETWNNAFVFSFVRNPWDRIVSLYHQPYFKKINARSDKSLEYFIRHYQPADWEKQFFYEYLNSDGIDFIGKFENRKEDLMKISEYTGVAINSEVHERKTNRNFNYRTYYTEETKQMVFELYQKDIEKYDYTF